MPAAGEVCWFHPTTEPGNGDCAEASATHDLLHGVGTLVSCGPVELATRLARHCPRLQRVVCVSSSSVHTKLHSANDRERRLISGIKDSEDALRRYCKVNSVNLALLRPTLIYGCGLDQNVSRIARLIRRFHFMPVAGQAAGRRQPLHAEDLARLVVTMLQAGSGPDMECAVGGGSVITYRELVERIFTGLGLSPRILKVPPGLLAAIASVISWLPVADGLNAEFVRRQNRDLVFDDSALRQQFGFDPRPFRPGPGDFEVPAAARSLQPR